MATVRTDCCGAVKPYRSKAGFVLAVWVALLFACFTVFAQAQPLEGAAARGRNLFTGQSKFQNGGPACIACHSTAGIGFPNGGTLGPNLSNLYSKLGPVGARAVFETLFFPTMVPIYSKHPLVPAEQDDLLAFFQATANTPKPPQSTGAVLAAAVVGAIIFLFLTTFFWRKRVLGVRERMVKRTTAELRAGR